MGCIIDFIICALGYERVYLPLCEVADTYFYIQGTDLYDEMEA